MAGGLIRDDASAVGRCVGMPRGVYDRSVRRINPDRNLTAAEKSARYRAAHLEERREQDRLAAAKRRASDPNAANARNHVWASANREQYRKLIRKAGAKWRATHPGVIRARTLIKKYGLTPLQFVAAIHFQMNKCRICRREFTGQINVDHDHQTGAVRGMLCNYCNTAIGKLRDDPVVITRAADYVRRGGNL